MIIRLSIANRNENFLVEMNYMKSYGETPLDSYIPEVRLDQRYHWIPTSKSLWMILGKYSLRSSGSGESPLGYTSEFRFRWRMACERSSSVLVGESHDLPGVGGVA